MKKLVKKWIAMTLFFVLLLTTAFTMPIMAETDDQEITQGPYSITDELTELGADSLQSTDENTANTQPEEQVVPNEKDEQLKAEANGNEDAQEGTEPEESGGGEEPEEFEKKSNKYTAEEEAALIAKYGYYHGTNATRIPVITYHNVVTNKQKRKAPYKKSSLAISKSKFNQQMKWLKKKKYRTINCEEFYLWHEGKIKLPKKSVLITFDDGLDGVVKNALPVLRKYKLKGTFFVIGSRVHNHSSGYTEDSALRWIRRTYPNLELQSHTYDLHYHFGDEDSYNMVMRDAAIEDQLYHFQFHAYPYGRYTAKMAQAYKDSGIKMAFTYGNNKYATRSQDLYAIERIKINAGMSLSRFKKWMR